MIGREPFFLFYTIIILSLLLMWEKTLPESAHQKNEETTKKDKKREDSGGNFVSIGERFIISALHSNTIFFRMQCGIVKVSVFVIIIILSILRGVEAACASFSHSFIITQGGCGKAPKLTSRVKSITQGYIGTHVGDLVRINNNIIIIINFNSLFLL